jgi:N-acetylmuramoyl-L-alanine amidase
VNEYVDSEVVPFFVLPGNFADSGIAVSLGDVARITYGDKSVFAIFADVGPKDKIGEASIAAIQAVGGNPWNADRTKIVRGIPHGVVYEILPGTSNLERTVDFDSIQKYGEELFGEKANPAWTPYAPQPDPQPQPKRRVLIDPGHSEKEPGARGLNSGVQEEDMNRFQAQILKRELARYGILGDIVDPEVDDLYAIGQKAKGYDAFQSLHLNAYKNKEFYTCVMVHPKYDGPASASAKFASQAAIVMSAATGNPLFSGTAGYPKGVMAVGLSVLSGAVSVGVPLRCLSEAEFIDDESGVDALKVRLEKYMVALAKVYANHWSLSEAGPTPQPDPQPQPEPKKRLMLHAVRKGYKDQFGNEIVALSAHRGDFKPVGTVHCVTGQYYAQVFRRGGTGEQPGTYEPLPQGKYSVGKVDWAVRPGLYQGDCGNGVGPVWIALGTKFDTERGGFGIHLDLGVHGTAGCLGVANQADMNKVVAWFADPAEAPQELTVDWKV